MEFEDSLLCKNCGIKLTNEMDIIHCISIHDLFCSVSCAKEFSFKYLGCIALDKPAIKHIINSSYNTYGIRKRKK